MHGVAALLLGSVVFAGPATGQEEYYAAYRKAAEQRKFLLVDLGTRTNLDGVRPADLKRHVICRVAADIRVGEETPQRLLDHSAFKALHGQPGLAVIDLTGGALHGDVVSVLPQKHCSPEKIAALLALPPGTLTQRTLCWAFMIHPERPQSVYAAPSPELMAHCARHSSRQAAMNDQHHDMNHPGRTEIVAESWPWNKNVVDAAIDIVWSWRQSPAHWGAARQAWNHFGYDMRFNGEKWYATGVFE